MRAARPPGRIARRSAPCLTGDFMATSKDYRLGEYTFPRGWFMIADAAELDTHKPLAARFFGQHFAPYRGRATGKVVLLDAYCPHAEPRLAAPHRTAHVVLDH